VTGRDKKGPTAVLKSVSKVDPLKSTNHLFNQSFAPQFLKNPYEEVFANYLKTFVDLGIHHVQFTTVGTEKMLDAQKYPEKHTDLIVRVCGYSAYFIDLSQGLQEEVIKRTEQCLA
jgi:formate C-acetyltransferase